MVAAIWRNMWLNLPCLEKLPSSIISYNNNILFYLLIDTMHILPVTDCTRRIEEEELWRLRFKW